MGRSYAGALGLIAFATTVARGVLHQGSAAACLPTAAGLLFVFAGVGFLMGSVAQIVLASDLKNHLEKERERLQATTDRAS